jgi:hypothetical protein
VRNRRRAVSHRSHLRWWLARARRRILPGMPETVRSAAVPAALPAGDTARERTVAETMRRVHDQLRSGAAPSFEALLAYGEPA